MNKLSNIKIGKKLALGFGAGVLQLAVLAGLALWAMSAINSASEKAQQESQKSITAMKVNATLSELALRMTTLATSKRVSQDAEEVLAVRKVYAADFEYLKANAVTDEGKRQLGNIEAAIVPWREANNRIMEAAVAGKHLDASKVGAESLSKFGGVKSAIAEFVKYRQVRLDQLNLERQAVISRLSFIIIALSLVSLLTAALTGTLLTRSISKPLAAAVAHLDLVAGGDLSHDVARADVERGDEIGLLSKALQTMSVSLRDVLHDITSGIHVVSSSSTELSANSGQMSGGSRSASQKAHAVAAAAEQMSTNVVSVAAGMEQTTTNLSSVASATEQMTATIGEIANNSEKARRITEEATRQAARIGEQMNQLGAAAQQIGKVTETITEISS